MIIVMGSWISWHYNTAWRQNNTSAREQWTHVVIKYEGTTAKLYLNGAEVKSITGVPNPIEDRGGRQLFIGSQCIIWVIQVWNPQAFNGEIDDVRLYNRPLKYH